ncbi:MAG: polysaccharide biosynthesis tyrosine autokinase [Candidatus Electryonea clarkiae]|nr:polysaccharide biosynthesis tyrosine autokinase [Candidatus Electryonea clarkiae]MDP8288965.1 polysaccharide biosynthesis tyrosine autokinase [Candidatus Electryonea clarkiae]
MAQYDLNLRDYQRILRRRWKVIVVATILVTAFSYYFGQSRQPLYRTFSSVKLEETSTVAGLLLQRLTYSRWDNIATAQELIKSYPVMEQVAKKMDIIPDTLSSEIIRNNPHLSSRINSMINMVVTERTGKTNIIDIVVTSPNALEARDIAQYLGEVFTLEHLIAKSGQDRATREFIENQLETARVALKTAERKLQEFRENNPGPIIEDHIKLKIEELVGLSKEKRILDQSIKDLEVQLNQLDQRLGNNSANTDSLSNGAGKKLSAPSFQQASSGMTGIDWMSSPQGDGPLGLLNNQIIELEFKKRELLEKYKPTYSGIRRIDIKIENLLRELRNEISGNLNVYIEQKDSLVVYISQIEKILKHVPEVQRQFAQMMREVSLRESQYGFLTEKYAEALIREADQADEVTIVRPAMVQNKAININMSRTLSVGFIIGMMLGLVLAFFFETFDTSIGTIEDVEDFLEVPVLGVIPHIDIEDVIEKLLKKNPSMENNPNLDASARLVTHFSPKDPVAESYRTLRTTLQFRSITKPVKTIVATSAALQEGKSTTLVNLAITLAQDGSRVLVVGCNLRRPTLYKVFGLEQSPGVTDIVLGRITWQETLKGVTDIIMGGMGMDPILMTPGMENLHIITSGGVPPNPSEMLGSANMKKFMDEIREEFDIVLFDAPPILPVTDAAILSNRADATLLIYRTGKVPRAALRRAKVQIEAVGATVLGVVLNDLKSEISGYAGSHYYYGKFYGDKNRDGEEVSSVDSASPAGSKRLVERLRSIGSFGRR